MPSRLELLTGPLIVDDVDGDGLLDIVVAPHYRVQIFNGQTGKLKAEVPWDVGRNYGALFTRPCENSKSKDIFVVCNFMPHIDCIGYRGGAWRHVWGHKYVDPSASTPQGREKYIRHVSSHFDQLVFGLNPTGYCARPSSFRSVAAEVVGGTARVRSSRREGRSTAR